MFHHIDFVDISDLYDMWLYVEMCLSFSLTLSIPRSCFFAVDGPARAGYITGLRSFLTSGGGEAVGGKRGRMRRSTEMHSRASVAIVERVNRVVRVRDAEHDRKLTDRRKYNEREIHGRTALPRRTSTLALKMPGDTEPARLGVARRDRLIGPQLPRSPPTTAATSTIAVQPRRGFCSRWEIRDMPIEREIYLRICAWSVSNIDAFFRFRY